MAFYSEFSGYYETVFPFRQPVLDFLNQWLPPVGRILDLGCGTGAYCGHLSAGGRPCLGVDLDPEMIGQARARYPQADFQVLDLEAVGTLSERGFAGAYCIGNVLPHLPAGKLAEFLVELKTLLKPGGIWIFQTVNFDPIIGHTEFVFPVLEFPEQDLRFHRRYTSLGAGSLSFHTRLVHAGEDLFSGEVALYPRTSSRWLECHLEAGFQLKGHHADFTGKPFVSSQNSGSVFVFSVPEVS